MTMQSGNAMGPEAEGPNAENVTRSAKCGSFPFSWVSCSVALAGGPARAHRSNGPSGARPGRAMLVLFCLIFDRFCLPACHAHDVVCTSRTNPCKTISCCRQACREMSVHFFTGLQASGSTSAGPQAALRMPMPV